MTKRDFLRVLTMGAAAGLTTPLDAKAQKIRLLPGAAAAVDPIAAGATNPVFRRFVAGVRVGEARSHGPLRILWLRAATSVPGLDVATLEEARTRGDLIVTERAEASVPALIVDNRGTAHALLMAGEILLGGKQHRVITEDVLLPPRSGSRDLAVFCVEQGRWTGRSAAFESRGSFAAPRLRSRLMEGADQHRVWAEVARYAAKAEASSLTNSYQAIYDKPEVKRHQEDVTRALGSTAPASTAGAAVFANDAFVGLDLFQDAGLFTRQWPKLLHAYALEVYDLPAPSVGEEARRRQVERLLRGAAATTGTLRASAGEGQLFEFPLDRFRGAALVAEDLVVHATVL